MSKKKKSSTKTGWEPENRKHFDEIVEAYERRRLEYPCELFKDVLEYSGIGTDKKAIEIGAGTGKATMPFLDAGYHVTAVELGENMTAFLQDKFMNNMSFSVVNTAFENASLPENSYDLIYAATAFHWVNPKIGCPKIFRLLKTGGAVALFRYHAIAADGERLYEDIQAVYEKHFYSFYTTNNRPVRKSKEDFMKPSEILHGFGFEDLKLYGFTDISMKFYDGSRTFSPDEYIELLDTMSDHRGMPEENRATLFAGIKEAILRHGGHHEVKYIFQLYMGRKQHSGHSN
jgi:ubiquinone/menaquinone biosynthesis C-methylase UbiE